MAKQTKLALIDAHALIHRAYHALPPMSTSAGTPTNAVYGFTAMLLKVMAALKPTHMVAAFDVKGPTFRHDEYKDYKAHRPKADEELIVQFDLVRDVVRAFNIPILEKKGYEADDIIGTLTAEVSQGAKKIIVTGDMDVLQLVDDTTTVFTLKRGVTDTVLYTAAGVRERFGFAPPHLVDYKGLCGDVSDNIPGVAGIGEKTAQELVAQFGSIENIYEHMDELKPRVQAKLRGQKTAALQSRRLATIRRDVPLTFDLAQAQLSDYDQDSVRRVFAKLEFRSFLQRLPKSSRPGAPPSLLSHKTGEAPLFPMPAHYHLVEAAADIAALKRRLVKAKLIAFDTETERLGARGEPIVGMSFALRQARGKPLEAWYVPVTRASVKAWQDILENPAIAKVGHNLKYDYGVLKQSGLTLSPIVFDSMIASYLLRPDGRQHSLDALAAELLDHQTIPITDLIGTGKEQRSMADVPRQNIAVYAAEDAEITLRLYEHFSPKLKEEGLTRVMAELEVPLIPVLADMELTGVQLDTTLLAKLGERMRRRVKKLKARIWQVAGEEFNVNSTLQLRRILYEKLLIPTDRIARTQTGYSTAAAELAKIRDLHPIIALLEEYRELTKLLNTYIATLPTLVDPQTKRIHTSFNQTMAATGRLSSSDPNLQQIPARTELGQAIRAAFVADRGKVLIKADYSQLELRIAAHISQDAKMVAAFRAGEDIHRATAAWVYGIEPAQVTDAQRREAKTLNFGVLYGMGPRAFAQAAGISLEQARSFIERYQEQYIGITRLVAATVEQARSLGFVETLFGRRRYVPEINAHTPVIRAQAERIAFNFPIQGTEADLLKKAMIALQHYLKQHHPAAAMVLTVHDELVCEVPATAATAIGRAMKKIMEGVTTLDVPLVVEVSGGPNWRDVVPLV